MNQRTLIEKFVKGATKGTASNMYIENDILYSYGRHFPLLVRMNWGFLLNADKYSNTTSQHQSACSRHATIQIPFSALQSAGVPYRDIELVQHEKQRYDIIGYENDNEQKITVAEWNGMTSLERSPFYERTERRPESAIIQHNGKCYLSSMDGNNFFLCMLPEPVGTVEKAFASLKPIEVSGDFKRQGEWFFVQKNEMPILLLFGDKPIPDNKLHKFMYKAMEHNFVLPNINPDGNHHIATRGMQIGDDVWVSGQIRHQTQEGGRGDHQMLRLSTLEDIKIFQAYRNRAVGSWSASGNVD